MSGEGIDISECGELNNFLDAAIQHVFYSIIRYNYIASTLIKGCLSVSYANNSIHL